MIILTTSGGKSGLREWVLQRLSAVYLSGYTIFLLANLFLFSNEVNYYSWFILFSSFYFKIATILFIFSLVLHSNIGMGIIIVDYVKQTYLRVVLDFIINLILLSYIFCIMQILWGFK